MFYCLLGHLQKILQFGHLPISLTSMKYYNGERIPRLAFKRSATFTASFQAKVIDLYLKNFQVLRWQFQCEHRLTYIYKISGMIT